MAKRKTELQKLIESDSIVEECYAIAFAHFKDEERTNLWFRIPNPELGPNMPSPIEIIKTKRQNFLLSKLKDTKR